MGTYQQPQPTLQRPLLPNHHYHHYHEVRCLPRLLPSWPCHGPGRWRRRYSHGCRGHGHGTRRLARHGRHQDHHRHLYQDRRAEHQLEEGRCAHPTIPTVIPTVVPTTTPVSFIGYADWTSAASSLTP